MSVEGPRRPGSQENPREPRDDLEGTGFASIIRSVLRVIGGLFTGNDHGHVQNPLRREDSFIDLEPGEGAIPTPPPTNHERRTSKASQSVLGRNHSISDASSESLRRSPSLTTPQRDGSQDFFGGGARPIQITNEELNAQLKAAIDDWGFLGGFILIEQLSKEGRISKEQSNLGYFQIGYAATESKTYMVQHYADRSLKSREIRPHDEFNANKALRLIEEGAPQKTALSRIMERRGIPVYGDEPAGIKIKSPVVTELLYPSEKLLEGEVKEKGFEGGVALIQNWVKELKIDSRQANEYYFFLGRMACDQNNEYQAKNAFSSMPKCEARDFLGNYIQAKHPEWFDSLVASPSDQFLIKGKVDPFEEETGSFTSIISEYSRLRSPPSLGKIEKDLSDIVKAGSVRNYEQALHIIDCMRSIPKFPKAHLDRAYLILGRMAVEDRREDIFSDIISLMSDCVDRDQLIHLIEGKGPIPEF